MTSSCKHPDYVKAKGIIEDSDMFDADFSNIPQEKQN